MRTTIALACAAAAACLSAHRAPAQSTDTFPVVTLPGTQLVTMRSAATGRDYDIQVSLPADYAKNRSARYPVLYVLDGQWDFKLMLSVQGGLTYDRWTPQIIIVGITWSGSNANYDSLRAMDLTPAATRQYPGSGAAPQFLSFIRDQLVPYVEAHYRADARRRILMGASFGGLFTLYALCDDPGFFWAYLAGSPAVAYAGRIGFALESSYAASHRDLPARLYVAVGSIEPLAGRVQELWGTLRGRGYAGLQLETRVIEGERHSGNKPEAFNRGLRWVFASP